MRSRARSPEILRELILVELDDANILRITTRSGRETDRRPGDASNDPLLQYTNRII